MSAYRATLCRKAARYPQAVLAVEATAVTAAATTVAAAIAAAAKAAAEAAIVAATEAASIATWAFDHQVNAGAHRVRNG